MIHFMQTISKENGFTPDLRQNRNIHGTAPFTDLEQYVKTVYIRVESNMLVTQ